MENYKLTLEEFTYTFLTKESLYWFVWQLIRSIRSKNIYSYTSDDVKKLYKDLTNEDFL